MAADLHKRCKSLVFRCLLPGGLVGDAMIVWRPMGADESRGTERGSAGESGEVSPPASSPRFPPLSSHNDPRGKHQLPPSAPPANPENTH